jgi:hypothetical protein
MDRRTAQSLGQPEVCLRQEGRKQKGPAEHPPGLSKFAERSSEPSTAKDNRHSQKPGKRDAVFMRLGNGRDCIKLNIINAIVS